MNGPEAAMHENIGTLTDANHETKQRLPEEEHASIRACMFKRMR
jgi:hypothetical protein